MMHKLFIIFFILVAFIGCSKTTVVLLDSGKSQNAILIANDKGEKKLDKVGEYLDLKDKDKAFGKVKIMSKDEIDNRFAKVLAIEANKPLSYLLYFKSKTELTVESQEVLKEALEAMKKCPSCTVDIIGHTDTTGSAEINVEVSLKRARYIESLIQEKNIELSALTAKGFGENDLLVQTEDNQAEEKNRNVEIFIK